MRVFVDCSCFSIIILQLYSLSGDDRLDDVLSVDFSSWNLNCSGGVVVLCLNWFGDWREFLSSNRSFLYSDGLSDVGYNRLYVLVVLDSVAWHLNISCLVLLTVLHWSGDQVSVNESWSSSDELRDSSYSFIQLSWLGDDQLFDREADVLCDNFRISCYSFSQYLWWSSDSFSDDSRFIGDDLLLSLSGFRKSLGLPVSLIDKAIGVECSDFFRFDARDCKQYC